MSVTATALRGSAAALALALLPISSASAAPAPRWATVGPTAATPSVHDDTAGGKADADDPAIWVSPTAPADSVVLGTLKNGGLDVYALDGSLLQHVDAGKDGRWNNVDVVQGARIGDRVLDLAVVSDRGRDRLRVFAIDPRGAAAGARVVRDVTAPDAARVFSATEADVADQETAYGVAAGRLSDGSVRVLATRRHSTDFAVLDLVPRPGRHRRLPPAAAQFPARFLRRPRRLVVAVRGTRRRSADGGVGVRPDVGRLVRGQEDVGIWRISGDTWSGGSSTASATSGFPRRGTKRRSPAASPGPTPVWAGRGCRPTRRA